ncbi:MAG: hypothetical protein IPN24_02185 [Betaproteobacteria bacterium]|nr:hypothetical protein [Betaproteobacteria bacterium]
MLHVAVRLLPLPASATAPQPPITAPLSANCTTPVGAAPVTVAVNTTFCDRTLGLADDSMLVVVSPADGTTTFELNDAGPVPMPLVAVTVNV